MDVAGVPSFGDLVMATLSNESLTLDELVALLDVPSSYYEKAILRYRSIGEWLCRDESTLKKYNPIVHAQGSFRFGTVIRPLAPCDEYDLDTVCELLLLTKALVTQKWVKEAVGDELELYAAA